MCLTRKKIYTNAHRLYEDRYTAYELSIPCGHCTECRRDKSNEWRARSYYQYLDTIQQGGFVLWDRLSYNDENLPHLKGIFKDIQDRYDFTCFNADDIKACMKRLRTNLEYEGYEVKNAIKYLIAAEYGQEEGGYVADKGYWREATLRPHYHIELFCTAPITPEKLSIHLRKAWQKGTTNGVEDNPTFFRTKGILDNLAHALNVSEYIGKYCMKNQEFDKVADYKIRQLMEYFYKLENNQWSIDDDTLNKELKKPEWRKRKNQILKKVKTFHTQSNGFGLYAKEVEGAIKDGNLLGMPDRKKIYWWQKLPMYYQRKLYYDHKWDKQQKKVIWYLNETGKEWKLKNLEGTIKNYAKKLHEKEEFIQSPEGEDLIRRYHQDNAKGTHEYLKLNDELFTYRNGRSWEHYAEYIIYHKGRIWQGTKCIPEQTIRLNERTPLEAHYEREKPMFYNYCHVTDIDELGSQMVTLEDLGDVKTTHKKPTRGDELKPKQFANWYCINEDSREEWQDYDKLSNVLEIIDNMIEWQQAELEGIHNRTTLTWKGMQKTLFKNITS